MVLVQKITASPSLEIVEILHLVFVFVIGRCRYCHRCCVFFVIGCRCRRVFFLSLVIVVFAVFKFNSSETSGRSVGRRSVGRQSELKASGLLESLQKDINNMIHDDNNNISR